jgi:hypothetical protein
MWTIETRKSVAVDFGGGDTTLGRAVNAVPDLQQMMESAGLEPVALRPLTPRSSDLTPLAVTEHAGFKPRATALILNEGTSRQLAGPARGIRVNQRAFDL